jgi:hypothetical protein
MISVLPEGEYADSPYLSQDNGGPAATQPKGLMQVTIQRAGIFAFKYNYPKEFHRFKAQ